MNGGNYSLLRPALIKLMKHQWPGNIRELRNCLQMAAGLCTSNTIDESNLHISETQLPAQSIAISEKTTAQSSVQINSKSDDKLNLMEKMESEFISQLLKKYSGSRKLTASEMNISERTLYRKLKRLNLNNPATI
jgi:DNA-binding NtrC family response regulator